MLASGPAAAKSDQFAVLLSGDGGWAGLDKEVAGALSERGIPVAGVDSLRYFWKVRTPAGLAADLDRIIRYYAYQWKKKRVLLIGYSQGADVLPFAINRLPAETRDLVQLNVLIGLGKEAAFEFHVVELVQQQQRHAHQAGDGQALLLPTRCACSVQTTMNRFVRQSARRTRASSTLRAAITSVATIASSPS